MERLTGIGVSAGVAVGRAVILTQRTEVMRFPIPPDRVDREVQALHAAREQSRRQLRDISDRVAQGPGSELAALFDAQILMLDDEMLIGQAEKIIRTERVNAAWAVHRAYEGLYELFSTMEDPYLRERENDVADVAGRLRMNLRHGARGPRELLSQIDGPSILIADELTASVAAQLDWSRVQGFATDAGSRTYHTAILARSLEGAGDCRPARRVAARGRRHAAGPRRHDRRARRRADARRDRRGAAPRLPAPPARHRDRRARPGLDGRGVRIRLEANIELLEDLEYLNGTAPKASGCINPSSCCRAARPRP